MIRYFVLAVVFCGIFTACFAGLSFLKPLFPPAYERWAHALSGTAAAGLTTLLFLRLHKQRAAEVNLFLAKTTFRNFLLGLLIGIVLMGLLTTIIIQSAGLVLTPNTSHRLSFLLFIALPLIPMAFLEELAFRAYPFEVLKKYSGTRLAILSTSLLFALYHLANGWSIQDSFLGAGAWGMLFGLAAAYSGGIAMPTGLHFGVNLTTAAFGATDQANSFWILRRSDGTSAANYQSSQLETLLPQIAILLTGILLMEIYLRKKK